MLRHEAAIGVGSERVDFIVQKCHEVRQTEQDSVHSNIAGNIDSNIKSQIFA